MRERRDIIPTLIIVTLAVIPLVFFPVGEDGFFTPPKLLILRLIVITYLFWIFKNRDKVSDNVSTDWINRILLLYFAWLVFSTLFSIDIRQSILGNLYRDEGLTTILIYFAIFLIARQQGTISKKNIYYMLIAGCFVVMYGILQSYGLEFFPRDYIREKWIMPFSTIGNPNFLGTYIVLLLPFAVHLFVIEKKKIGLFIYALLFYGLLTTMTRGTWIGAFISVLLYLGILFKYRQRFKFAIKDVMIFGLVTFLCLLVFDISTSGSFFLRLLSITLEFGRVIKGGENLELAGSYRMFIWLKTIELIKMRPFVGFGLENLQLAFEQYYAVDIIKVIGGPLIIDRAHNEYLHIAVSSGIPALILYLSFITLVIRKGVARLLDLPYAIPLLVAIFGYLVQAFFNISVVSVAYIFWAFLGFLASSKPIETE
ncbi:MAG: O-antigen ligase family protein [Erysipelotrichaceae bacterium]|nr:O-antigen ligase family protein [Erysipelotrichaceae bacterium]